MTQSSLRRIIRDRAPSNLTRAARMVARHPVVTRNLTRPRWGNLRRDRPFSQRAGADRGTPIHHHYAATFLEQHASHITGAVLETNGRSATDRLGQGVTLTDVVDVNDRNLTATILADLADPGCLSPAVYDCVIATNSLQAFAAVDLALGNLWGALKPGGWLFVTMPTVAQADASTRNAWRVGPDGIHAIIERACDPPPARLEVAEYGNLTTQLAALLGLAAEELRPTELARVDADHPLGVTVAAQKP